MDIFLRIGENHYRQKNYPSLIGSYHEIDEYNVTSLNIPGKYTIQYKTTEHSDLEIYRQ
jgi:hypothetical protein